MNLFRMALIALFFTICAILAAVILWIFLSWIFIIAVCLFISLKKEYTRPSKFYSSILNYGYFLICRMGRVKYHFSGIEKVPFDTPFLFISNHRSKFDNMIECLALKKTHLAFISKEENFSIPIARRFMKRNLYLSLSRGNPKEGLITILKAGQMVKNGVCSVGVYPEGKRSVTGDLLEFKAGCFKIAEKASCPIVVGVITGSEKIHKNWPLKTTHVYFNVVQVFSSEDLKNMKSVEICDKTYTIIKNYLNNV